MFLSESRESVFPHLTRSLYRVTSPETDVYNCLAFAAGDLSRWWEPDPDDVYFWPPGVGREYTVHAFIRAFESIGYVQCGLDSTLEPGFTKVTIYADVIGSFYSPPGFPKHVAIQQENGKWKSKLGIWEDIEHKTLECLYGNDYSGRTDPYGEVVRILKRPAFATL